MKSEKFRFLWLYAAGFYLLICLAANILLTQSIAGLTAELAEKEGERSRLDLTGEVDEDALAGLEARYFWGLSRYRGNRNLYSFSQSVKEALESSSLSLVRYERQERDREEFMEFTIEGRPENFLVFLIRLNSESQAFKIPYFYLENQAGRCRITFLIGFALIDDDLRKDIPLTEGYDWSGEVLSEERVSPVELADLFQRPVPRKKALAHPDPVRPVEIAILPQREKREFLYVGKVSMDNDMTYYIKEQADGKIVRIPSPGWQLVSSDEEGIVVMQDEIRYEVSIP